MEPHQYRYGRIRDRSVDLGRRELPLMRDAMIAAVPIR